MGNGVEARVLGVLKAILAFHGSTTTMETSWKPRHAELARWKLRHYPKAQGGLALSQEERGLRD